MQGARVAPYPGDVPEARPASEYDRMLAKLLNTKALLERPRPDSLVEDFLELNTNACAFGLPDNAKTFVGITVTRAVATGTPWFGRQVHRGPVVYVIAEGGDGFGDRIRADMEVNGLDDMEDVHYLVQPINLMDRVAVLALAKIVQDVGPSSW